MKKLIFIFCLLANVVAAQQDTIVSHLDIEIQENIIPTEPFEVEITTDEGRIDIIDVGTLEIYNQATSFSTSVVNGKFSSKSSLILKFAPAEEGNYTVVVGRLKNNVLEEQQEVEIVIGEGGETAPKSSKKISRKPKKKRKMKHI